MTIASIVRHVFTRFSFKCFFEFTRLCDVLLLKTAVNIVYKVPKTKANPAPK